MVERPAGKHINELDVGISDDESANRSRGNGHLDGQCDRSSGRGQHGRKWLHRALHCHGASHAAMPLIAIQPAGDGISGKTQDASPITVKFRYDRLIHRIDLVEHLFSAPLNALLPGKNGREVRKSGDICKEDRAGRSVG